VVMSGDLEVVELKLGIGKASRFWAERACGVYADQSGLFKANPKIIFTYLFNDSLDYVKLIQTFSKLFPPSFFSFFNLPQIEFL